MTSLYFVAILTCLKMLIPGYSTVSTYLEVLATWYPSVHELHLAIPLMSWQWSSSCRNLSWAWAIVRLDALEDRFVGCQPSVDYLPNFLNTHSSRYDILSNSLSLLLKISIKWRQVCTPILEVLLLCLHNTHIVQPIKDTQQMLENEYIHFLIIQFQSVEHSICHVLCVSWNSLSRNIPSLPAIQAVWGKRFLSTSIVKNNVKLSSHDVLCQHTHHAKSLYSQQTNIVCSFQSNSLMVNMTK